MRDIRFFCQTARLLKGLRTDIHTPRRIAACQAVEGINQLSVLSVDAYVLDDRGGFNLTRGAAARQQQRQYA